MANNPSHFIIMALIISSLNVTSLRAEHCDIYLLQETHVQSVQEGKLWESEWGGRAIFSPGSNRSAGVGILINPRSSVAILTHKADKSGHLISAKLKHNSKFQIFNVYAPNSVRPEGFFWQYTFRNVPLIVGGDFNCVPCLQRDKFGGDDAFGDKGVTELHSFTNSNSLIDIYRAKFPNIPMYTWVNGPRTIGCRLDRFYVPLSWKNLVSNVTAKPFVYSDHLLIRMTCTVGHSRSRSPGIWKFNTSLLKSDEFCEETNNFWKHWRTQKTSFSDPWVWWDARNLLIKQIAINNCVCLAKGRKSKTAALQAKYDNLLRHIDSNDSAQRARLLEIKESLKVIEDERADGIKIRSKENWLQFGKKPTKYFFQLQNKKQTKNAISALRVGSVTVQTDKYLHPL